MTILNERWEEFAYEMNGQLRLAYAYMLYTSCEDLFYFPTSDSRNLVARCVIKGLLGNNKKKFNKILDRYISK